MKNKNLKTALFRCCNMHSCLPHNEKVIAAVLNNLDVEASYLKEFNCCGYPLKNINFKAYLLSTARNLAIAEKHGLDIITFCSCCSGSLKNGNHLMKTNDSVRKEINETLAKEGLHYHGSVAVNHCLEFCYHRIGIEHIKAKIKKSLQGLKVATHYGCHILHPRKIACFDNPLAPSIFDQLLELSGAVCVSYPNHYSCCGFSICGIDAALSMDLAQRKISAAAQAGADLLCTVCPNCQLQFDKVQKIIVSQRGANLCLPSVSFAQLFGISLGIDMAIMGFDQHELNAAEVLNRRAV
jgi:heterodisulfide reductase subunit B